VAEGGGAAATRLGQSNYFSGQKLNFLARSQQPKKEKNIFLVFIKRKMELIFVQRDEVPEMRYFC